MHHPTRATRSKRYGTRRRKSRSRPPPSKAHASAQHQCHPLELEHQLLWRVELVPELVPPLRERFAYCRKPFGRFFIAGFQPSENAHSSANKLYETQRSLTIFWREAESVDMRVVISPACFSRIVSMTGSATEDRCHVPSVKRVGYRQVRRF